MGGVLIDKAATLVGSQLSDIQGATYDPVSKQIVFLGTNNTQAGVQTLDMDYFFTAVKAVYGSAEPPYVSLDSPATPYSAWTNNNGGSTMVNGTSGGFLLRYNPYWANEDHTVDIRIRAQATYPSIATVPLDFTLHFTAAANPAHTVGGRPVMYLTYTGTTGLPDGFGLTLDQGPFSTNDPGTLTATGQDTYYQVTLNNNSHSNIAVTGVLVLPDRQHRRFGGRIDNTKLGWVLFEADRVMKCLAIGKDNLTGATYDHTTVNVPGFANALENAFNNTGSNINARFWFEPNQMSLMRSVDPTTGAASIVFSQATVSLLTETFIQGLPDDPNAKIFADFFTSHYDQFAALNFPVIDPNDPTHQTLVQLPIFKMLKDAMQAVSLARFFRDNQVPLDMWWLNSWTPPVADIGRSIPTAFNEIEGGNHYIMAMGGVTVNKPNDYVPSITAADVALAVASAQPADTSAPTQDTKQQTWTASTSVGNLKAVSVSMNATKQDGNVKLAEMDLNFASPGAVPFQFTRYYRSNYLGTQQFGPGWQPTRFVMQFSRPSWYDATGLMKDSQGIPLGVTSAFDTTLRSGQIRVIDMASGKGIDFDSSMGVSYALDNTGNPVIQVTGLAGRVPTFAPGTHANGSTLTQNSLNGWYSLIRPDGTDLEFDSEGRIQQVSDRNGYSQYYWYDANNRLYQISDGALQTYVMTYNASGLVQSVAGPAGEQVNYTYDTGGRLLTATHVRSGASTTYSYNTSNQLAGVTRFDGVTSVTSTADLRGRSSYRDNRRGNTTQYSYFQDTAGQNRTTDAYLMGAGMMPAEKGSDSQGRATYKQDPYGNTTLYGYSGNSLSPNSVQLPTPGRPAIKIARNTYGQPTQVTDPAVGGQPVNIQYNAVNLPTQTQDQAGRVLNMAYDATYNLTQVTQSTSSGSATLNYGYQNGYMTTATDPLNHTTTYNRDLMGRITSVVDPTGVTTSREYDSLGRLWKVHDPRMSGPIVYSYNNFDRVISVSSPAGTVGYVYDGATARLTQMTDVLGRVTTYQYNGVGDITSSTQQLAGGGSYTTTYGYDQWGNLTALTPPGAQPINFGSDALGQLNSQTQTDTGIPGAPKNLASNNATDSVWCNQATHLFTWGAPDSDVGIAGYNDAFDGSTAQTVNTTAATVTISGVTEGKHTFKVKAESNSQIWGSDAVFNLWVDLTPPTISGVSLTPQPVPLTGSATLTVSATVSDALSGMTGQTPRVRWCVSSDSTRNWSTDANMTTTGTNQWSGAFTSDWSQAAGKTLYYQVIAQDAAGNVTVSPEASVSLKKSGIPFLFYTK